ncbi:hypothetical protein N806_14595 [Rhodococcus sp. P27]|nr:hypothetical protein N806_14595 [Rhodococcus sp. P27]
MDGETKPLALQDNPWNTGQTITQDVRRALEILHRVHGQLISIALPVRPDDFETVTTGVPDPGHANSGLDVRQIAAGDHADRAMASQPREIFLQAVDESGSGWVVHDVREGTVEVKKDDRSPRTQKGRQLIA